MAPSPEHAQTAPGFGILGDSGSDEYRADDNRGGAYWATTFNWAELLARYRGVNLGPWGTWSAPRRSGYAYNWARSGARTVDVIAGGQADGLAAQVAAGQVGRAMLMIGVNDFSPGNGTYAEIYDGTLSAAGVTAKITAMASNIRLAIEKLQTAGPVTMFVATVPEQNVSLAAFPDPVKRARVTDAIVRINNEIRTIAAERGAVVVDNFTFGTLLQQRIDANGFLRVGTELISVSTVGDEPHHLILGDNAHGGTVANGLLANFIMEAMSSAGDALVPFTDEELLANAGIEQPDTIPPQVTLTAPLDHAVVVGSVDLTASASDNVGVAGVQFKLDGANLGSEDTTAPYSRTWSTGIPQNGTHTLTAVARDAAGHTSTAVAVTVTVANVDTTAPSVSLTAPASGATIVGPLTVSASASDNVGVAGVTFFRGGVALGPEDTQSPYSITVPTDYTQNGTWSLVATARDAAGNQRSSTSRSVTIANPVPDAINPTVTFSAPAADATVAGNVSVSASASDNVGVVGVRFRLDGANLGAEDTSAPYGITWNTTTIANGSHSLTATARDAAGNTVTATRNVTVANVPPQIIYPASYTIVQGTYQSGGVTDLVSDDNAYLATRGVTSGYTGYAQTELAFQNVAANPIRLDFTVIAKSSTSSTTLVLQAFNVTTGSWTQLSSASIGTGESTQAVSITASPNNYRDATGRVRLRVRGSKFLSTFTVSHEVVRLTAVK
jgi:hypothetical protein